MKKLLLHFLIAFVSISTFAEDISKQDLAKIALDSTVMVVVNGESEKPIQFGSGFVIDGGKIVTNHHVVSGGYSGYIQTNNASTKYKVMGIWASDEVNDLVVLEVQEHNIPALSISDIENVVTGDSIYVAGSPLGYSGTFSEGIISSIRKTEVGTVYQITAPISQGSSGGPVLNNEGVVIGVSTATLSEGQNINFASPSFYIKPLIESSTSLKPFSYVANTTTQKIKPDKKIPQEKSDEICCAFGIKLGENIKIQNFDKDESDSLHVFLDERSGVLNAPTYNYTFNPANPYDELTKYIVSLVDKNSVVYKLSALGVTNNKGACESEQKILVEIIKNKYEVNPNETEIPKEFMQIDYGEYGLFSRFNNKYHWKFFRNERVLRVMCEATSYTEKYYWQLESQDVFKNYENPENTYILILEYLDLSLEALKDKNEKQYLMNQKDSSGI